MRNITIMLFLILISCKNETKTEANTENGIDKSVDQMWKSYTKVNPEGATEEIPDADFYHNNEEDANRLGNLVLTGKKKASSSLYALYGKYNIDLPKVGNKQIVTNFDGKALAIIETTKVDTIPFNQISTSYAALDMGTDKDALKNWKKAHWDFFEYFLAESGEKPTQEMIIVCETFKTIWPE